MGVHDGLILSRLKISAAYLLWLLASSESFDFEYGSLAGRKAEESAAERNEGQTDQIFPESAGNKYFNPDTARESPSTVSFRRT